MSDPSGGDPNLIEVRLPDDSRRSVPRGTGVGEILRTWAPDRAKKFLAARFEGSPVDLEFRLLGPGALAPVTFEERLGKEILHHSAAHLVAKAVMEVIPEARPTVGPGTEEGFHYDFDVRPLTPDDFDAIRTAAHRIVAGREPFRREELSREAALDLFKSNPHKIRYIEEATPGEPISVYRTGDWADLCRGPHVPDTGWIAGIHLLGFSAVTQGGEAGGLTLQRIRGVAFPTREELASYLSLRKEAEARDHRALGQRLELFMFVEEGPGFPFWLPRGMVIVRELERFVMEHLRADGYSEVRTPLLFAQSVFETSGHWEHYRADMFLSAIENRVFGVKPMNCPGSMLIFRSRARSYRELPLRLAEFAPLHRLEASGTIHGMTRVRELVQDDAHLFVTEEQVEAEVRSLLAWIEQAFSTFRLAWSYELSTRPKEFLGEPAVWDRAEATLKRCLDGSGVPYRVSPGEGAFYGPKIDIHLKDSMGRSWQTGTIQLDYQMPLRFHLEYQGADGQLHAPIVIHRTILGSFERFVGILLEHTAGRLPPWLSPTQIRVLPVGERHAEAARALVQKLTALGLRAELSVSEETLGKRVRTAEMDRVPYIAVLGDRELADASVSLRAAGRKEAVSLPAAELGDRILDTVRRRAFEA
ncbi:MAG: threonine--tRNA ligase [Thermoplasmata archaeon]|nr:threonine--tRNA ligase [Thermoplasmata archaeon]